MAICYKMTLITTDDNIALFYQCLSHFIDNCTFSCYSFPMIIEQTVTVPADYRIQLDLPRTVPVGVTVRISITISTAYENQSSFEPTKQ